MKDAILALRGASEALSRVTLHLESLLRETKILIVEDDADIREALASILTKRGYVVFRASSARLGLEAMRRDKPDVVLLDLAMAPMSGWDVIEAIHADPSISHLPILIITATQGPTPVGFETFRKPIEQSKLVAAIDRLCALSGRSHD